MEEKKWNAGSIGLTFAGSFLGAGYVSGQELWQFFGSFGGGGLLGVLAAMALLAVFGLALMYIISRTGIAEMDAVLVPWERLAWLRKLSSALQLILLFGVIAIMYAGGGALLEQLFSLPTWLGRTLMAVLVTLVALRGLRGAVGAFSLIVPVIVALTLLFGGMALARYGVSLPAFGAAEGSNPLMRSAAFGAVTFAFYNFFGSVGILAPLGEAASSGKAARRGVLLGTALLLLIAYSVLLAVMAVPETADAELPMLALAYGLSRPLGYVYGVLLLLCMYGSALSMTVAITTYASARSERVEKRRGWFILALGALGYAASSVGFGDLISVVYPVFGYCSSVFIVCLLVHAAQTRKKEYKFFENSGTKEEEISSLNQHREMVTFCIQIVTISQRLLKKPVLYCMKCITHSKSGKGRTATWNRRWNPSRRRRRRRAP